MLWRQYKLKALNSSPSICTSWRHIQTTVKFNVVVCITCYQIIFRGACIGNFAALPLTVPALVNPLVPYGYLY